jgi:aspartate aminotransferase-like enzyme
VIGPSGRGSDRRLVAFDPLLNIQDANRAEHVVKAVESKLKEDPAHETKRFGPNKSGFFPYTPATNLLYGLREAIQMLQHDEGLDNVFRRHYRHAGPAIASACKDAVIRSRRKR